MAMIDYGAIAFKNGKLISTDMFTPMKDTCGWSDEEHPVGEDNRSLDGNYFVICGDKDLVIGFYKERICWWYKGVEEHFVRPAEWFNCTPFIHWKAWEKYIYPPTNHSMTLTVKPHNGYYIARWKYKGDKYKVYFGRGIDYDTYKKYHIVNYYRSLPYYIKRIYCKIKHRY